LEKENKYIILLLPMGVRKMIFTPAEVSVLLCSAKFGVDWNTVKEVILSDLIVRGHIRPEKKLLGTMLVPTEKARRAHEIQVLRQYELKLLEEFGKKGVAIAQYMEGSKGFKSFKYMDKLVEWSQREGLIRLEKGRLAHKHLPTERGEELSREWRRRLESLQDEISKAYSSGEEEGKRIMGRYLPWVRIMQHITADEEKPKWLKMTGMAKYSNILKIMSALLIGDAGMMMTVDYLISSATSEKTIKYLKPEESTKILDDGKFNEDEEIEAYYPTVYSRKVIKLQETTQEEAKFCISCGQKIKIDVKFCPECGEQQ